MADTCSIPLTICRPPAAACVANAAKDADRYQHHVLLQARRWWFDYAAPIIRPDGEGIQYNPRGWVNF